MIDYISAGVVRLTAEKTLRCTRMEPQVQRGKRPEPLSPEAFLCLVRHVRDKGIDELAA